MVQRVGLAVVETSIRRVDRVMPVVERVVDLLRILDMVEPHSSDGVDAVGFMEPQEVQGQATVVRERVVEMEP